MKPFQTLILLGALMIAGTSHAHESQVLKMKIEGMTCGMCVRKVQSQLSSLCKEIAVDLEKGEGICKYEPPVTPEKILAEANKTGFKTTKID